VAKETNLSPTVFSDWKSGKSKPKVDKLQKIATYLGVKIEDLIE
jgi:repressor LexA